MKCDVCGKEFKEGNRPDGIPNGMSFIQQDGETLTMCAECIIEEGRRREGRKNAEAK